MYLILIPDEKAQCPQSSIDLFYIEVEGVQLHQPEADKILAIMHEDSDKKKGKKDYKFTTFKLLEQPQVPNYQGTVNCKTVKLNTNLEFSDQYSRQFLTTML